MSIDSEVVKPIVRIDMASYIAKSANRLVRLCELKAPEIIIEMERATLFRRLMDFPVDSAAQAMSIQSKEMIRRAEQDFLFAKGYYSDVAGDMDEPDQSA